MKDVNVLSEIDHVAITIMPGFGVYKFSTCTIPKNNIFLNRLFQFFKNICHLQWQVNLMGAFTLLWFFLNIFVLKVNCDLYICVIYVREDNDSNVFQVMITRLEWTTWTRMSVVPKRLLKFNYSLIQLNCWYWCLCPPGCVVVMVTPHVNQAQVKLKQLKT